MTMRHRIPEFAASLALVLATASAADPAQCPQTSACDEVRELFMQQRSRSVIRRVQNLPPDLQAALVASTGSRLIANASASKHDWLTVAYEGRASRFNEHQFSIVSSELAAIVYRTSGPMPRHVLLLFMRSNDDPVCRFHLRRPLRGPESIGWTLERDFAQSVTLHAGCGGVGQ